MLSSLNKNSAKSDFGEKTLPHVNHLYTLALFITGDESKAEKILLNTYAEAFSVYNNLSGKPDINLWLTRTMINICKNLPSSENSKVQALKFSQVIEPENLDTDKLQFKPSFKITQELITNIACLPNEQKEALILIDILKFSYSAAADLIDTPERNVRERIIDARESLLNNLLSDSPKHKSKGNSKITSEDKIDLSNAKKENYKNISDSEIFIQSFLDKYIEIQQVRDAVYFRIIKEYAPDKKDEIKRKNSGERKGVVAASTIAMIILIIILIFVSKPNLLSPKEIASEQIGKDNILVQLKNNYLLFAEGKFNDSMIWDNEKYLSRYLKTSGFESEPVFFSYDNWELAGVFTTKFDEHILANYFYKNSNGKSLYIYQVPASLAGEKKIIKLSENLLNFLNSGKCFSHRIGDTVYLIKKTDENIFGYAINIQDRDLILEISLLSKTN